MEKTLVPQALHTDEKTTVPQALHTSNAEDLPVMRVSADEKTTCNPSDIPPQPLKPLPAGFDPELAYLLGQCCRAASDEYSKYVITTPQGKLTDPASWQIESVKQKPWNPDLSQIEGYTLQPPKTLTVYEQNKDHEDVEIPAGFMVVLGRTDTKKSNMIVVVFHGTQNNFESNKVDNRMKPAPFVDSNRGLLHGSVHGGFHDHYYVKSNKDCPSLSKQVHDFINETYKYIQVMPVKVTGHSMGGALATLCAVDLASSFDSYQVKPPVSMYSLASPRVADALATKKGDVATFVSYYQQTVPDSYRIVNTEDPVPKSPSAETVTNACAHVLGDSEAEAKTPPIVKPSSLDDNLVSFTDKNERNDKNDSAGCKGKHSLRAVYLPFLDSLTEAS